MASKGRDPAKSTFYLDNSTLCDAFRAHAIGGATPSDPAYRPLLAWVERVAREANLCVSLMHLAELARWRDEETANAMACWYDSLPIVWVRSMADVQDDEDEYWTKVAANVRPQNPPDPFATSLLRALRDADVGATAELLAATGPALTLLTAMRVATPDRPVQHTLAVAQYIRSDRAWAEAEGWSDARKREAVEYNRRVDLRKRAMAAGRRLHARCDAEYEKNVCSSGDVQERIVMLYEIDCRSFPCFRALQRFNEGLFAFVMKKQPGGGKERRALSGTFYDAVHLSVGAAYCDVFTCDEEVSDWLGDFRHSIGRAPQLAVGSRGVADFVDALMATWP